MPNFDNKPNHVVIDEHGNSHWISRSMAVVVTIILNDEKVLLVKRGPKISSPGKWCNPCGYLDWNESATQCVLREVWEETGLDLTELINTDKIKINLLNYPWDLVTNPSLNHNQDIALYFGVTLEMDEEPILTNEYCEEGETEDVKWVALKSLHGYEFAFNHDKRIEKFLKHIENVK